jgi:predicted O-methyltransferase YrrM
MAIEILIVALLLAVLAGQWQLHRRISRMEEDSKEAPQALQSELHGLFNQLESYHYLRDRLNLRHGMPYTTDWSAAPDFLKLIVEHCLEHKPTTIMECSSGLTTVMLARCCEMNGSGHVYSLENGAEYADKSRSHLQRYALQQQATVMDAPLQRYQLNGSDYQWYAMEQLPDNSIEMLVIDGPPGFIQKHSRYPALPLLHDKLADGCVIFLDDAARQEEKEIVEMWQAQFPGLEHRYLRNERGCSILRLTRAG